MNPLSPSIRLFLKFWSNSPPWCWPSTVKFTFWKGSQNANYNQRLVKKKTGEKTSISPSYPNDELQNMHLLCFWENVVKFWDLVVFNSYNIPSADTLRLLNESGFKSFNISRTKWVFCKHYIYSTATRWNFCFRGFDNITLSQERPRLHGLARVAQSPVTWPMWSSDPM